MSLSQQTSLEYRQARQETAYSCERNGAKLVDYDKYVLWQRNRMTQVISLLALNAFLWIGLGFFIGAAFVLNSLRVN